MSAMLQQRRVRLLALLFSLVASRIVEAGPAPAAEGPEVNPLQTGQERVERMLEEGEDLLYNGAFGPALEKAQAALQVAEPLASERLIASCLILSANAWDRLGKHSRGWELYEQALRLSRGIPDRGLEAAVLAEMGFALWRRSEYPQALEYCRQAAILQAEIGDKRGLAKTLVYIGRVHFKQADYEGALEHHRRALALQEEISDRRGQCVTLEDLGDAFQEQGAYAQALKHYERSLRTREDLGDRVGQSRMLTILGRCFLIGGSYRKAHTYVIQALSLAEEIDDLATRAFALHHLGIIESRQGLSEEAIRRYEGALKDYEKLGDRREQAWVLSRMGDVRHRQRDLLGALVAYQRAGEIWEEIQDPRGLAGGLERSGLVSEGLGEDEQALDYYERARKLREETQPAFLPSVLVRIGGIYAKRGNRERALEFGHRAVELAGTLDNGEVMWRALHSLGSMERQLGLRREALESFRESLSIVERLRAGGIAEDEAKTGLLDARQIVYSDTIRLLMEMGEVAEALEVAERARARAFLDLLGGREVTAKRSDLESLSHIRQLERDLRRQRAVRTPEGSESRREVSRGEDPINNELRRFAIEHSELASLLTVQAPALPQLRQEARRSHATIVEYFVAEERLFLWVVTPRGEIRARATKIAKTELEGLIRQMRRAMRIETLRTREGEEEPVISLDRRIGEEPPEAVNGRLARLLRRLHRILVEPIEGWLPKDPEELVTIVPHGPLFQVSFACLLDRQSRYFIERHTIHYTPAISVLRYTEKKRRRVSPGAPQLLLVGNPTMPLLPGRKRSLAPLPGAEAETLAIAKLYPSDQVTTLTGPRAEESLVRELAPGQTIIHLATHAVIFDDEPLESLVALAPTLSGGAGEGRPGSPASLSEEADGLLTVREVFSLDLHAGLVTLSACNTALGRLSGDGVIGLSRAFIYAGTPTVMASLWRVADQIAKFQMERFYQALSRDGRKASALRDAQLATIQRLRAKSFRTSSGRAFPEHPIFWAPFVLIGEAS